MGKRLRWIGLVSALIVTGYVAAAVDPITVTAGGTVGVSKDQPDPQYSLDVGGDVQVSGNMKVVGRVADIDGFVGTQIENVSENTVHAQIDAATLLVCDSAGAIALDVSAGADVAGRSLIILNKGVGTVTVTTTLGAASAAMGTGDSLTLLWSDTAWQCAGSTPLRWVLTSGTSATWVVPWTGAFQVATVGGGGGSGGSEANGYAAGGGGAGGAILRRYWMSAGESATYTVGVGGSPGAYGVGGGSGGVSTFAYDAVLITANGGGGGGGCGNYYGAGGGGGSVSYTPVQDAILLVESAYGAGSAGSASGGGAGGGRSSCVMAAGAPTRPPNGWGYSGVGYGYGAGASGAATNSTSSNYGGAVGAPGVIIIESTMR